MPRSVRIVLVLTMGVLFVDGTARAVLEPAQRIVIVSPQRLLVGPWQVPLTPSAAELEVFLGGGRECPGGRLRLLLPALAATAFLDDPSGVGCQFSPPRTQVLGLVLGGRWRTDQGVHIGSTLAAVRAAYPNARPVKDTSAPQPGWWDSRLPFVHLQGRPLAFGCGAVEFTGFPCAQLAFDIRRGRVAAISVRTGFHIG